MTIAVLASPDDGLALKKILTALVKAGLDAYGLVFKPEWERLSRDEIIAKLAKASHLLAFASPQSLAASWFPFAAGFGYSRSIGYAIARFDDNCPIPSYMSGTLVMSDLAAISSYYSKEMEIWVIQDSRRSARATLLEMGISCHNDSLAQCTRDGDTKAVELFLKAGFPPDVRDKYGVPLLCLAARGKHVAVAELLIKSGASLDLQSEDRGYSPLMDASQAGSAELVRLFIDRGAGTNLTSKDGQTALVVAVGRNDAEIAKILLQGGADPDLSDKLGLSARKYASLFKNPAMLSLFEAQ